MEEKAGGRARQPPPGVSSPPLLSLPVGPPLLSSSVSRLWSLGCRGSRAGRDGGGLGMGRGRDADEWNEVG